MAAGTGIPGFVWVGVGTSSLVNVYVGVGDGVLDGVCVDVGGFGVGVGVSGGKVNVYVDVVVGVSGGEVKVWVGAGVFDGTGV